jgi:hypothetical protein
MEYLIIEHTPQGLRIKDSITDIQVHYIGYTLRQAERKHRDNMNIRYRHMEKIFV